jgi:hypothetical protein
MTVGKAVAEVIADVLVVGRIVLVFMRASTGSIILSTGCLYYFLRVMREVL